MPDQTAGIKATFVVQLRSCANSSWQGTVSWVEGKQEQHFRSALELMRLMEEPLTAEDDDG